MATTGDVPTRPTPLDRLPRDLRTPARWALALGALSVVAVVVLLLGPATRRTEAGNVATAFFFGAGVAACIWVVRVQRICVRAHLIDREHYESALWIMWVVPVFNLFLPAARLARFDRVLHGGRRGWAVYRWGVAWALFSMSALTASADPGPDAQPRLRGLPWVPADVDPTTRPWVAAAIVVVTFALWAVVVLRLTRAGERTDAETTQRRAAATRPDHDVAAPAGGLEGQRQPLTRARGSRRCAAARAPRPRRRGPERWRRRRGGRSRRT